MPILTLLKLFLTLASSIAKYAHDRQLMEAGAAQSVLEGIKNANDAIARATIARNNIDSLPITKDDANRDN